MHRWVDALGQAGTSPHTPHHAQRATHPAPRTPHDKSSLKNAAERTKGEPEGQSPILGAFRGHRASSPPEQPLPGVVAESRNEFTTRSPNDRNAAALGTGTSCPLFYLACGQHHRRRDALGTQGQDALATKSRRVCIAHHRSATWTGAAPEAQRQMNPVRRRRAEQAVCHAHPTRLLADGAAGGLSADPANRRPLAKRERWRAGTLALRDDGTRGWHGCSSSCRARAQPVRVEGPKGRKGPKGRWGAFGAAWRGRRGGQLLCARGGLRR